jgi:uncharacterized membrane protein YtjA (UPF0391 family)
MLRIAIVFLVVAVVASVFAFGVFADHRAVWAKVLSFSFLGLALASWLVGTFRMWSDKKLPVARSSQRGPR